MELAPGLHRIGNDIVAAYLVVTGDGVTVIDAGLPGHRRALEAELADLGRSLDDVRGIVVTHGDSDHLGFAEAVRAETGVAVYVHEADADRARGGEKPTPARSRMRLLPTLEFAFYALRRGAIRTRPLTAVRTVRDGDVLDLPGAPRIVGMPGHSPGSVAVHVDAVRAVFVGDALTTRHVLTGVVEPQPAPFTDDPAQADASLDRLAGIDADWVLPGHGGPWHGSPAELVRRVRSASQGAA